MFDDLEAQFHENVLPAYKAFAESLKSDTAGMNSDLRLGKDAALALFHLREHVPWANGKAWPAFLNDCPEYVLLKDIVNVFKHGPRRDGQIAKPTDIYETTVMTEYQDAGGPYRHITKEVTIELRDGSIKDLQAVLRAVLNMWIREFKSRQLLQRLEESTPQPASIPPRPGSDGAARQNLSIIQGVRFQQNVRMERFNYATGVAEPIDITGHQYQMSIYEPIEADIVMTNPATGQTLKRKVELSAEETVKYRTLTADEERKEYEEVLRQKYGRRLVEEAARNGTLLR